MQCVVPYRYIPWYIWTKEGFKLKDNHLKANQATIMNNKLGVDGGGGVFLGRKGVGVGKGWRRQVRQSSHVSQFAPEGE